MFALRPWFRGIRSVAGCLYLWEQGKCLYDGVAASVAVWAGRRRRIMGFDLLSMTANLFVSCCLPVPPKFILPAPLPPASLPQTSGVHSAPQGSDTQVAEGNESAPPGAKRPRLG